MSRKEVRETLDSLFKSTIAAKSGGKRLTPGRRMPRLTTMTRRRKTSTRRRQGGRR